VAEDGGTDYVLYRKDRVRCVQGGGLLEERRLKSDSPARRMYARCCNTAMFVDFTKGHWLTVYRGRLPENVPPATMRLMTAERPEGVVARGVDRDGVQTPGRRRRATGASPRAHRRALVKRRYCRWVERGWTAHARVTRFLQKVGLGREARRGGQAGGVISDRSGDDK
jgi:hypothetical protein